MRPMIKNLAAVGVALFLFLGALAPALATDLTGINTTRDTAGLSGRALVPSVAGLVRAALGLVGVIFVIMMIYAGFIWMTAQGSEEKVSRARGLILGAVIGLVIIFSGYAITQYVFKAVGGI